MGHWLAAEELTSRRSAWLAGIFLGLAVQSKLLAVMLCPGACFILAVRLRADRPRWKAAGVRVWLFLLGCIVPTALLTPKFSCLGGCRLLHQLAGNI